jgi:hypothetical protein
MTARRKKRPLVREGEPTQVTPQGLEIPIPTHEDFSRLLDKAAKKENREKPSQSDREKR